MSALSPPSLKDLASQNVEQVLSALETNADHGLTSQEALERLKQFGPNLISTENKRGVWRDILQHFKSPLIVLLLVATVISFSVGETLNASIIFFIVVASVAIDFYQERDARNAAEKLKETVKLRASTTTALNIAPKKAASF